MKEKHIIITAVILVIALALLNSTSYSNQKTAPKESRVSSITILNGFAFLDFSKIDREYFQKIESSIRQSPIPEDTWPFLRIYLVGGVKGETGKLHVYQPALNKFVAFLGGKAPSGISRPSMVFVVAYHPETSRLNEEEYRQLHLTVFNVAKMVEVSLRRNGVPYSAIGEFDSEALKKDMNLPNDQSVLYAIKL